MLLRITEREVHDPFFERFVMQQCESVRLFYREIQIHQRFIKDHQYVLITSRDVEVIEREERIIDNLVHDLTVYTRKFNTYREAYLKCSKIRSMQPELIKHIWHFVTCVE